MDRDTTHAGFRLRCTASFLRHSANLFFFSKAPEKTPHMHCTYGHADNPTQIISAQTAIRPSSLTARVQGSYTGSLQSLTLKVPP